MGRRHRRVTGVGDRRRRLRGLPDHLCGRVNSVQAILSLIYCFLMDMIASFLDVWLEAWDSVLGVLDSTLAAIGTGGLTLPVIPNEYAWILGATGMSQALTIIAGALGVRFLLQTVPLVRWGS